MGNGLESNEVDFEVDGDQTGKQWRRLTISVMLVFTWAYRMCTGYRMYSVPGGLNHNACERVLYSAAF